MQLFIIHSGSKHTFLQAFNMFITFINSKYKCRDGMVKNTYLIKNSSRNKLRHCNVPPNHRPACSLIFQQCFHPRAGHDFPKEQGTRRPTHIQGYTNQPSQHSWVYQAIKRSTKPTQSKDQPLHTYSKTCNSQP